MRISYPEVSRTIDAFPRLPYVHALNAWFPDAEMDEAHYKLLRLIDTNPELSQRELAQEMGVSLGKVNYCINALIDRGWVKARNFRKSNNKLAYAYLLTPRGVQQKAVITLRFLQLKVGEYQSLKKEIAELRREVATAKGNGIRP